jgi:hypothetical protein
MNNPGSRHRTGTNRSPRPHSRLGFFFRDNKNTAKRLKIVRFQMPITDHESFFVMPLYRFPVAGMLLVELTNTIRGLVHLYLVTAPCILVGLCRL